MPLPPRFSYVGSLRSVTPPRTDPPGPGGPAQPRSAPCELRPRPAFPRRLNVADPLQRGLTRSGDISAFLPDYKDPPPPFRSASASSPLRHSEPPHNTSPRVLSPVSARGAPRGSGRGVGVLWGRGVGGWRGESGGSLLDTDGHTI